MANYRFYLAPNEWTKDVIRLSVDETYHLRTVLRLKNNSEITIFDGNGNIANARLVSLDGDRQIITKIIDSYSFKRNNYFVTLIQSLPKSKIFEEIIQRGVEIGLNQIIPIITERTVVRLDELENKVNRWKHIAQVACKQSGCNLIPSIHHPCSLKEVIKNLNQNDHLFLTSLDTNSKTLKSALSDIKNNSQNKNTVFFIGPEGGFSNKEITQISDCGVIPVSLGDQILRVSTAAIYCLSILHYELSNHDA